MVLQNHSDIGVRKSHVGTWGMVKTMGVSANENRRRRRRERF
jgi:hypothetical protein